MLLLVLIVFLIAFMGIQKIIIGIESALDMISHFLFYYQHSYLYRQALASVAGVTYSQQQAKRWFLF